MSTEAPEYRYDLFVIAAPADAHFVRHRLVPLLGVLQHRVLLFGDFAPGAVFAREIERGISSCRFSVVVLSPAFLRDRWSLFAEQLALHSQVLKDRLVPLILERCEVPARLECLVALDFSDPKNWETEAARLRRHLGSELSPRGPSFRLPTARQKFAVLGLGVLLAGLMLWLWLPPPPPPAAAPDIVSPASQCEVGGRVIDADSRLGLGQASVELDNAHVTTDDMGNFRMQLTRPGSAESRLLLRVSKAGRRPLERWIVPPVMDLMLPLEAERN